jgi:hypothetical protein
METLFVRLNTPQGVFQAGETLPVRRKASGYEIPDDGAGKPHTIAFSQAQPVDYASAESDHDGVCTLTCVSHFFASGHPDVAEGIAETGEIPARNVRFVHYPGSQQMVFHMPKYAWDAGTYRLINALTNQSILECPVREKLNGSTMILLDTYPLPPGFYTVETDWPNGWTHRIQWIKRRPGYPVPETYTHPPGNVRMVQDDTGYHIYDANGVEIPGESQVREQAERSIRRSFSRRIEYGPGGRGGTLYYVDTERRITFYWEFGGGDCIASIDLPTEEHWEKTTGAPLAEREAIVQFVAESVLRDQVPSGGFYKMGEKETSLWSGKKD